MKRALVTGASGFVGGHLVPLLQEKGFQVWASWHRRRKKFSGPIRWVRADLCRFEEALNLVRRARPETIFHLAATTLSRESVKDPSGAFLINVVGTIHLLEAAARFAPRARILLVSSSHVYGRTFLEKPKVREKDLANPTNPYGASKLLMEMAGLDFFKRAGLAVVIARGFNQLGAGQDENLVFSSFARQLALIEKKKRPAVLQTGNLNLIRDFVHVQDAVRAYLLLAARGKAGEIYNVGLGKGTGLRKGLQFLAQKSRARFKIKSLSSLFRRGDVPSVIAEVSKLGRLGWRPEHSVREGIEEMLEEWRAKAARF